MDIIQGKGGSWEEGQATGLGPSAGLEPGLVAVPLRLPGSGAGGLSARPDGCAGSRPFGVLFLNLCPDYWQGSKGSVSPKAVTVTQTSIALQMTYEKS